MKTGERIRTLTDKAGLSPNRLAELVGVSPATVRSWISDRQLPNAESLRMLSKIFFVSTDYLLGLEDRDGRPNSPMEQRLLAIFSSLDERGKETILRVAESEMYLSDKHARYKKPLSHYSNFTFRLDKVIPSKYIANYELNVDNDGSTFSKFNKNISFIDERFVREGVDYALTFAGRSMRPTIEDGDVLFISKRKPPENGDICLIETPKGVYVKNYFLDDNGSTVRFKSKNPNYRDTDLSCSPEDVEAGRIKYLGKLVKATRHVPDNMIIQTVGQ